MNGLEYRTGTIRPIECAKEGFERIKSDYWLLFAISLLGALIGGITLYILLGAMICGIYFAFLNKIDGKRVQLDDLWKGFQHLGPGLIVTVAIVVPMIAIYLLIYAPVLVAMIAGPNMSPEELTALLVGALAVDFIFIIAMVCFHTLLMFSFPLIVDRGLGGFAAMKTSIRAVWANLGGVAGLMGVNMVLSLIGMLTCGLGIYFLIPIMMAANAMAYRQVFPSMEPTASDMPPPPNIYKDF